MGYLRGEAGGAPEEVGVGRGSCRWGHTPEGVPPGATHTQNVLLTSIIEVECINVGVLEASDYDSLPSFGQDTLPFGLLAQSALVGIVLLPTTCSNVSYDLPASGKPLNMVENREI